QVIRTTELELYGHCVSAWRVASPEFLEKNLPRHCRWCRIFPLQGPIGLWRGTKDRRGRRLRGVGGHATERARSHMDVRHGTDSRRMRTSTVHLHTLNDRAVVQHSFAVSAHVGRRPGRCAL